MDNNLNGQADMNGHRDHYPVPERQIPTPEEQSDEERNKALAKRDTAYISDWNEDGWGFGG